MYYALCIMLPALYTQHTILFTHARALLSSIRSIGSCVIRVCISSDSPKIFDLCAMHTFMILSAA